MAKMLKKVEKMLDKFGLRWDTDKQAGVISMGFHNPNGYDPYVTIHVRESDLIFITPFAEEVPEERRSAVSDYIHDKNSNLAYGSLDFDQDEGRVWFRMSEYFGTRDITEEELQFGIMLCLRTFNDVVPELLERCTSTVPRELEVMYG